MLRGPPTTTRLAAITRSLIALRLQGLPGADTSLDEVPALKPVHPRTRIVAERALRIRDGREVVRKFVEV
jgi:hypothetical protein